MSRKIGFQKRAPRVDLQRDAVLVHAEGNHVDVVILEVSSGGFRIRMDHSVRVGEFVRLRVDRAWPIESQIRWVLGNEAGGVFLTPPEVLV